MWQMIRLIWQNCGSSGHLGDGLSAKLEGGHFGVYCIRIQQRDRLKVLVKPLCLLYYVSPDFISKYSIIGDLSGLYLCQCFMIISR